MNPTRGSNTQSLVPKTNALSIWPVGQEKKIKKYPEEPTRFELARENPNRFLVDLLNHSDKAPCTGFDVVFFFPEKAVRGPSIDLGTREPQSLVMPSSPSAKRGIVLKRLLWRVQESNS